MKRIMSKLFEQNESPQGDEAAARVMRVEDWESKSEEERTAHDIVAALQEEGTAYFAGGYVRDMLIEKTHGERFESKDVDIATELQPDEVRRILESRGFKTDAVGASFGVVIAHKEGSREHQIEIATFRKEDRYTDGRRPDEVILIRDAGKDAERRDFTINALFFDPVQRTVIDYVGGIGDVEKKILRPVGNAKERFEEDYLRMLRYVRFRNKYEFSFSQEVQRIIQESAEHIRRISGERTRDELDKMLTLERNYMAMNDLARLGLLSHILPEVMQMRGIRHGKAHFHKEGDAYRHTLEALRAMSLAEYVRRMKRVMNVSHEMSDDEARRLFNERYGTEVAWAVLVHDLGKAVTREVEPDLEWGTRVTFKSHESESEWMAGDIGWRLKFGNDRREKVMWLVRHHMQLYEIGKMRTSTRRRLLQHPWIEELYLLDLADQLGNFPAHAERFDELLKFLEEERARPPEPKELIDGKRLMEELDIKPGPLVGKLKRAIRDVQLEGVVKTADEAIAYAREQM